jgi:transposase
VRYIGIDVGSRTHVVAVVDESLRVLRKPTAFAEDANGYAILRDVLGSRDDALVVMEATGHYGRNLLKTIDGWGFLSAVINPLRTRRFAEEDLARTKTDSIDAIGLARFGAVKRPPPTSSPDQATDHLREMVRLRERLVQDSGDRLRQLHRMVDLCFPELTRHVRGLDSQLAQSILGEYPTASAIRVASVRSFARIRYDGRRVVGAQRARALIGAAQSSVGQHQGPIYDREIRYVCKDLATLREQIRALETDIQAAVHAHQVGALLTTIDGIAAISAARVIAAVGDPAVFRNASAFAAYVGVVPGHRQSGLRNPTRAKICPIGNASLRKALWMPTLAAVRINPWLAAHYQRLLAAGKPHKVALVACMRKLLTAVYSVAKNRKPFALRSEPPGA